MGEGKQEDKGDGGGGRWKRREMGGEGRWEKGDGRRREMGEGR